MRPLLRNAALLLSALCGLALIWAGAADAAGYASRTLRSGAHGSDVKQLQSYLRRGGHAVKPDGAFGSRTGRALRATQRDLELAGTGVATPRVQRAIRTAVTGSGTGGAQYTAPQTSAAPSPAAAPVAVNGEPGTVTAGGLAVAPAGAPAQVRAVIDAGNAIARTPYKWGGGHQSFTDTGYDCSGSVSFALHAAQLVDSPMVSGDFGAWGERGTGSWITVYSNANHVYMTVAGLRFDTSARATTGSRWTIATRSNAGFAVTHPAGL